jgi:hypothetical protein
MGWAIVAVNPQSCTQHVEHELQSALNGGHPIHPKNSPFKAREVLDCEAIEYLVLQVNARNYLAGNPSLSPTSSTSTLSLPEGKQKSTCMTSVKRS